MSSHHNQVWFLSQWWCTYQPLLINHRQQYHHCLDVLVPNQVMILVDGHIPAISLLVIPFSAVFWYKGSWKSIHSFFSSRIAWLFEDGLVSDGRIPRRCCWGRGLLMGFSVVFCIVKLTSPYCAYVEGVCGETMRSKPPNKTVWDEWLEPIAVPTRWALFGVIFYRDPVWPYSEGVCYTERNVGRHLLV